MFSRQVSSGRGGQGAHDIRRQKREGAKERETEAVAVLNPLVWSRTTQQKAGGKDGCMKVLCVYRGFISPLLEVAPVNT